MKFLSLIGAVVLMTTALFAQPIEPSFIKGDINIAFRTRVEKDGSTPKANVEDVYSIDLNVSNRAAFVGTIKHRPFISNTFGSNQTQQVAFDLRLIAIKASDPSVRADVGKLAGVVPVSEQNVYDYTAGNVKVAIFSVGTSKGLESKMAGTTAAKPPAVGGFAAWKNKALDRISLSRTTAAGTATIAVTKYDKMDFGRHIVPAGPASIYSEATVDGSLLYDYERSAWYLQDITVTYAMAGGQVQRDRLTGNIRWSDSAARYDFDVRVNEGMQAQAQGEQAAFTPVSVADAEDAFFAVDTSVSSLTGTMIYKDTKSGGVVTASAIKVDLTGNKLTRQQVFYLMKLLLLSNIVPLNSDDVDAP